MSEYVLTCDTPVDISQEHLDRLGVSYIRFHYTIDGTDYADDIGKTIPYPEFYAKLVGGADIRTSQANRVEYAEFFEPFVKDGKDVLHISFSSALSGSYNNACAAADELMEAYPGRKILVVDSLAASSGFGLFVDALGEKKAEGMEMEALRDWAVENRLRVQHWFLSCDLSFYIKGGRISRTAGAVASTLGICPLMHMDELGRLIPVDKLHTKKKTMKNIVNKMIELADGGTAYNGKCFMSHANCIEDANAVADAVRANFPNLNGDILINYIGTSIGSHTGPGTVALFFWGGDRGNGR